MNGINTGVLTQALPLSAEQINNLEKRTIENQIAFVYLDENSNLCFILPYGVVDNIKDLAWNTAYELLTEENVLIKKVYKKSGLKNYNLVASYTKETIKDSWSLDSVESSNFILADGQLFLTKDNLIFNVKE